MSQTAPKPQPSKLARYRARKRANGMRLLRMWVPDVNAPGFQEEIERQVALMNASPDEPEVTRWIDAVTEDAFREEPPYDWGPEGPPKPSGSR